MAQQPRTPKMGTLVAAKLRRRIVRGELAEGDPLPSEAELMEQFGVSRPTLREAFRLLESESLIAIRRGARGGARVQMPEIAVAARYMGDLLQAERVTLEDVYDARTMIEPQAARLLAERPTKRVLAALRAANERERQAEDNDQYADAAASFHLTVVELAGNNTLQLIVELLHELIQRHVRLAVTARERRGEMHRAAGPDTHSALIDLVAAGKPDEAERYWRDHLEIGRDDMLRGVSERTVVDLLG